MRFSTILFDLGSTLLYTKEPWEPIHRLGDLALTSFLNKSGIQVTVDAFTSKWGGFISSYYADQEKLQNYLEKTTAVYLQEILEFHGYPQISRTILRGALDELYAVTQRNWQLEEDALPTLEKFRINGLRMGLISNTSDDKNVQQLIDRWRIRPYMDFIITSAGFGYRKPDVSIFQTALDNLSTDPSDAAMVGDSLEADILGANLKGIFSIFINRRVNQSNIRNKNILPKVTISNLSQLLDVVFPET